MDDRIEFVDTVLHRRAGEHKSVRRAQRFDAARRLRLPVLDALRLVEHDDVRLQKGVDVVGVAEHLLVIDDREERRLAIGGEALGARSKHETAGRSLKRTICSSHSAFSEAGQTTRTRSICLRRASSSQAAIAWMVLPSPMSSASSARSPKARCIAPAR